MGAHSLYAKTRNIGEDEAFMAVAGNVGKDEALIDVLQGRPGWLP